MGVSEGLGEREMCPLQLGCIKSLVVVGDPAGIEFSSTDLCPAVILHRN